MPLQADIIFIKITNFSVDLFSLCAPLVIKFDKFRKYNKLISHYERKRSNLFRDCHDFLQSLAMTIKKVVDKFKKFVIILIDKENKYCHYEDLKNPK